MNTLHERHKTYYQTRMFNIKVISGVRCVSSYLIKAIYFLCGVNWFIASSTGRIHDGAPEKNFLWSSKQSVQTVMCSRETSRPPLWPAGISINIRTRPQGEEESSVKQEPYGAFTYSRSQEASPVVTVVTTSDEIAFLLGRRLIVST